jgi:hypothetical protein
MSRGCSAIVLCGVSIGLIGAGCSEPVRQTTTKFDLAAIGKPGHFFDFPFPSDRRLTALGAPDLSGYPDASGLQVFGGLVAAAAARPGFPTLPVAYFRFDAELPPQSGEDPLPAEPSAPILLLDVDPWSPERGRLIPVLARTFTADDWTSAYLLAVGPRPGFVLAPSRTYAVVVMRALGDATGARLGVPADLLVLAGGGHASGVRGAPLAQIYTPLWSTLAQLGIAADRVAAATVFTTGDVVAALAELAERVRGSHPVAIDQIALASTPRVAQERYCEITASIELPQFQRGIPPFNSEGLFDFGTDGLPIAQRSERAKLVITLPKQPMPKAGYPLLLYLHGSGGSASDLVDRGPVTSVGGTPTPGLGPAYVVAERGIAAASAALPLSPDRLPGAGELSYLNLANLASFRDTFRQGAIEQRLLLDALLKLELPPAAVAGCQGVGLPDGALAYRFDPTRVALSGQSMGAVYVNLVGAIEPRIRAAVPTGAGGDWPFMLFETEFAPGARELVGNAFQLAPDDLHFMHPAMAVLGMAWEPAEPFAYMGRLGRDPLPGHPVRSVYEPVGANDAFFSASVYDAAALAYGHRQGGTEVWPTMQQALDPAGLSGLLAYPVADDVTSANGLRYTGVVVQYPPDLFLDGHDIAYQRDEVKFQYGCFLASALATGRGVVPAPEPAGSACPGL